MKQVELNTTDSCNYAETAINQLLNEPYVLYKPSGNEYILNNFNYTSVTVPTDSFVNIQDVITLNEDYAGLNSNRLVIEGGTITGNGSYILNIGNDCVVNGTSFSNIDIDCNRATFINCIFAGNCLRIGNNSKFYNCEFINLTTGFRYLLGTAFKSKFQNCIIPQASEIINSNLINCIIGEGELKQSTTNNIIGCSLSGTIVYALQSDLIFDNNQCTCSKIKIGDAARSALNVIISKNQFWHLIEGANEIIEIDPQSTGSKIFTIKGNSFMMQIDNPYAIAITANNGNTFDNSLLNIQENIFWRGLSILSYNSDIKINYSQNIAFTVLNPVSSGNLVAGKNYDF